MSIVDLPNGFNDQSKRSSLFKFTWLKSAKSVSITARLSVGRSSELVSQFSGPVLPLEARNRQFAFWSLTHFVSPISDWIKECLILRFAIFRAPCEWERPIDVWATQHKTHTAPICAMSRPLGVGLRCAAVRCVPNRMGSQKLLTISEKDGYRWMTSMNCLV